MEYMVCGDAETRPAKSEYIDETIEHVSLRQNCLTEFKNGYLIAEVSSDVVQSA